MTEGRSASYHHGDLRQALLAVAIDMIATDGVNSVTLRELGRRLGVSRSAPYRHFADKSALLAAVSREGYLRLHEQLQRAIPDDTSDPLSRLHRLGVVYVRFAVDNPTYYRLMFGAPHLDVAAFPELEAAGKSVFDVLQDAIRRGQAAQSIKAGDIRIFAYAVWASVHGLSSLLIEQRIPPLIDTENLIAVTLQTTCDGIRRA